jgi:hypothetical protein
VSVETRDSMGSLITWFDQQFAELYSSWRELIQELSPESIYQRPFSKSDTSRLSCGDYVVKSARVVEQTFGGITVNLWDDPFEWTLPEALTTREKLLNYFDEVEATRQRGFDLFKNDEDLLKEIMTPTGETQLLSILLDTLVRARHHHLCASGTFDLLSSLKPKLKTEN